MDKTAKKQLVHSVIAVAFMLFFRFIPAPPPMTQFGMTVMGIFIGCIYAWCTVEMIWSSIFGLCLLGLTDYCSVSQALAKAATNRTVMLIFAMLLVASIASICKLTDVIADYLITRKIAKGRPWVLSFILLLSSYIGTALVDSVPAILICWGFLYTICKEVGYKPYEKWPELMVVGIVYASIMGFILFPFKVAVVANYGFLASAMGQDSINYSYMGYIIFAFIFGITSMVLYLMMCKYILRADASKLISVDLSQKQLSKMDGRQKIGACLLGSFIILMLMENFLPHGSAVGGILKSMGTTGITIFFVGLAIFIPYKGKPYMSFKEMADHGLAWPLLFMIGAAMTLAVAMVSKEAGFQQLIMESITPLLGESSSTTFIIVFLLVAIVLTNLINNVVVSVMMIPIMYPFSQSLGFNPVAITAVFLFITMVAVLLPSSSPAGAMIHGNREWIKGGSAIKYGLYTIILSTLACLVIGVPLSMLCFS